MLTDWGVDGGMEDAVLLTSELATNAVLHAGTGFDVECSLLFADDEVSGDRFDPSDAGRLWDLVNRQDWAVCESVQRGMSSRSYRHGWFAPMEDDSLDIRRWLLPLLGEQP